MDTVRILLQRYAKQAWKHRWASLALAWAVCLGGWAAIYAMPNIYEANARLYVDADAVLAPLLRGIAAETEPASQIDILTRTLLSRPNIETLIQKTDLELSQTGSADHERLVTRLAEQIKVRAETRNLLAISYRDPDPKRAAEVVQTLMTIFIENATGGNRSDMNNARRFLEHQIASYEQQLRSAEKRRADFKSKYLGLLPAEGQTGGSGLDQARALEHSLQGGIADAEAKRDQLHKELDATSPLLVTEAAGGGAAGPAGQSRLQLAEQALADLQVKYTDSHPDVVAARNEVAALRKSPGAGAAPAAAGAASSASAPSRGGKSLPNPVYEQIKTRLLDTESDLSSLRRRLAEATAERDALEVSARAAPGVQAEFESLDRDYSILRSNYEQLLARRESANIAQAADTQADKVKIQPVDPPQVPRIPVAPNRRLLTSGVLLAGIGAGFGLAFMMAQLDRSFRSVEDLRALGLTVLGGISAFAGPAPPKRRMAGVVGFGAGLFLLVAVYGGLVSRMARITAAV